MSGIWSAAEKLSTVIGVILRFVTLPAAVIGVYAFWGEIRDGLTPPDLAVAVDRMTIRCFYRFQDQESFNRWRAGDVAAFVETCDAAPLAVSFTPEITNTDSISRTVSDVIVSAELPFGDETFDETWEVVHEIDGSVETNVRRPWLTLEISPGRTIAREVWISQDEPPQTTTQWREVRDWLNTSPDAPGAEMRFRVAMRVSGAEEPVEVATCRIVVGPDQIERFRSFAPDRQLRFTALCEEDAPES